MSDPCEAVVAAIYHLRAAYTEGVAPPDPDAWARSAVNAAQVLTRHGWRYRTIISPASLDTMLGCEARLHGIVAR